MARSTSEILGGDDPIAGSVVRDGGYFTISATQAAADSSDIVSAAGVPTAKVTASQGTFADGVHLSWPAIGLFGGYAGNAIAYAVKRTNQDGATVDFADSIPPNQFTTIDYGAAPGEVYTYTAYYYWSQNGQTYNRIFATTTGYSKGFNVTQGAVGGVTVSWNLVTAAEGFDGNAVAYAVKRTSQDGVTVDLQDSISGSQTSITLADKDTHGAPGEVYYYALYYYFIAGNGATLNRALGAETGYSKGFNVTQGAAGGVTVSWNPVTYAEGFDGNAVAYAVKRINQDGTVVDLQDSISGGQTSITLADKDTHGAPGEIYTYGLYYYFVAGNGSTLNRTLGGETGYSKGVIASQGIFSDGVHISWPTATSALGYAGDAFAYALYRTSQSGVTVGLGNPIYGQTSFDDTTAAPGQVYTYTVKYYWTNSGVTFNRAFGTTTGYRSGVVELVGTTIGTSGSYKNSANTITKATDGNLSTFFDGPTPSGNWVGLDLGKSGGVVTEVKYASRPGFASRMNGGIFQASNSSTFASGDINLFTIASGANPGSVSLSTAVFSNTTAYRYYRYLSPSNSYGDVSEVQFFGTAGGLAQPKQLSGTTIGTLGSYKNDGNTIAKVTDGSLNSFFDGPVANGNWVGLDLGSTVSIDQIAYAPRSGFASRMVGGEFQISTTADFSSGLTAVYTVTTSPPSSALTVITLSSAVKARYVRYLSPTGSYGDISEFEVFGG